MLLLWCLFGGLLLHFSESLLLDILLKTNYEKPVDTAQDVLDRGLAVIGYPGKESIVEIMKISPSDINRKLAKMTIVPKVNIFHIEI